MRFHSRGPAIGWLFLALIGLTLAPARADTIPLSQTEVNIGGKLYRLLVSLSPLAGDIVTGGLVAPSDLALVQATKDTVRLVWRDNSFNETQFAIFRRTPRSDWARVAIVAANVTVYTDTGLQPNQEYFYRVRATNNQTASDWTAPLSAWTQFFPPDPNTRPVILFLLDDQGHTITSATTGGVVVLAGARFGTEGTVTFNHQLVRVLSWTDTRIRVRFDSFDRSYQPGSLMIWRTDGEGYETLAFSLAASPEPTPTPIPPVPPVQPIPEPLPQPPPIDPAAPTVIAGIRDAGSGLLVFEGIAGQTMILEGTGLWIGTNSRLALGEKILTVTQWTSTAIRFTLPPTTAVSSATLKLYWTVNTNWVLKGQVAGFTLKPAP
jgi:hypothetical protein